MNNFLRDESIEYCEPLVRAIIGGIEKRFSIDMDLDNHQAISGYIAAVTHPYFKTRWLMESKTQENIEKIQNILFRAVESLEKISSNAEVTPNQNMFATEKSSNNEGNLMEAYFVFNDCEVYSFITFSDATNKRNSPYIFDNSEVRTDSSAALMEILKYLNKPCESEMNNLGQLNEFPLINRLYQKYNVILASEADIERLFSFAGMILRPQRRSMDPDIFEKLLILHSNDYQNTKM